MSKSRGFKKLKGITIGKVDAACVNYIVLYDEENKTAFHIEAEVENGIPVLTLKEYKNRKTTKATLQPTEDKSLD